MKTPTLKFAFDSKRDCDIAYHFYCEPQCAGVDFWQKGALTYHEKLAGIAEIKEAERKKFLCDYVQSLFLQHKNACNKRKKEIEMIYKKEEYAFFHYTTHLFKNHPWPQGKYIAYLSFFDFCPRFLGDKTFFVFLYDDDDGVLFTIFHEMLHIIFYDYCITIYPHIFAHHDTEKGVFWEIAEIFNAIVQNSPTFPCGKSIIHDIGYPELRVQYTQAQKAWHGDVDEWITNYVAKIF